METKEKKDSLEIKTTAVDEKIAKMGIDMTSEQVAIIKNTVAKGTTNTELAFFLNVCKTTDLNPFIKEIWCYKDSKGNLITFASRDGFLKKAQRNKSFNGIRSSDVCMNDQFTLDIPNGKVDHEINFKEPRGKILGAYAMVFRKDGEPTIEWADIDTYDKKSNAWGTHKAEMMKKVAEVHALKKAFGISSLQSEYDFEIRNNTAIPVNTIIEDVDFDDDAPAQDVEAEIIEDEIKEQPEPSQAKEDGEQLEMSSE